VRDARLILLPQRNLAFRTAFGLRSWPKNAGRLPSIRPSCAVVLHSRVDRHVFVHFLIVLPIVKMGPRHGRDHESCRGYSLPIVPTLFAATLGSLAVFDLQIGYEKQVDDIGRVVCLVDDDGSATG
jgi:hypothetical protein